MCYFLTIGVPASGAEAVRAAFGRGFQVAPTANRALTSCLPQGFTASLLLSGMCSCDLFQPPRSSAANPEEHLRRKYEKQGWSEAKIARAIRQAQEAAPEPAAWSGLREDVVERLQTLCAQAGSIAVFVHWYRGDVESERLAVTRADPCACSELLARAAQLRENELLVAQ